MRMNELWVNRLNISAAGGSEQDNHVDIIFRGHDFPVDLVFPLLVCKVRGFGNLAGILVFFAEFPDSW